jgi:hypothetical protein
VAKDWKEIMNRQHRLIFRQVRNVQNWGRMIRYNVILGSYKSKKDNMTTIRGRLCCIPKDGGGIRELRPSGILLDGVRLNI